ncbi:hypothetical protein ACX80W_15670 [Arthrobacter sp. TMN-37]
MPSSDRALAAPRTRPAPTAGDPPHFPQVPACGKCGTDRFLTYDSYTPAERPPDGGVPPARTSYTCTRCGTVGGHDVPAAWRPPGWFYCT